MDYALLRIKGSNGELQRVGNKRGWYSYYDSDLEEMDIIGATGKEVDVWLPLDLDSYVKLFPGNIAIFAGGKDAGKSAFLLNIAKENRFKDWDTHYYSSEMGANEMRVRMTQWPEMTAEHWYKHNNFHCYERASRFEDVIPSGEGNLVIIDYLEQHGDFYAVGEKLKRIHDKLNGAVCILAIQKKKGEEFGRGGEFSLEVSRLYVTLDYGKAHIVSAKNFKQPDKNPRGLNCRYKLHGGYNIQMVDGWHRKNRRNNANFIKAKICEREKGGHYEQRGCI